METEPLRATVCKYEESSDRTEISDCFLFHQKHPFGEPLSKIVLKSSIALFVLSKIEKLKIRAGIFCRLQVAGCRLKNGLLSLSEST